MRDSCWVLLALLLAHGSGCLGARECFPSRNGNALLRSAVTTYVQKVQTLRNATARMKHPLSIKYGYPIGTWCTRNVSRFDYVFANMTTFNEPLRLWNTSLATSMIGMFDGARAFDQTLPNFVTARVTRADLMFRNCRSFRGRGLGRWDTSRLVSASSMFEGAINFDADIGRWNTSRLRWASGLFRGCQSLNRTLASWDVRQLRNATGMFFGALKYSYDLCAWADKLPNDAAVGSMFRFTACHSVSDPWLLGLRKGRFCRECRSSRPKLPSVTQGPIPLPLIPVAMANLPDGRIVTWAADRQYQFIRYETNQSKLPSGTFTSIFDPVSGNATLLRVEDTGQRMFCPGVSLLADGCVLISGGEQDNGTTLYNPWLDTWTSVAQMNVGRGYNSQITLSNGQAFTLGGSWSGPTGVKYGELYDPVADAWTPKFGIFPTGDILANDTAGPARTDNYFSMFEAVNGKIFHAGPAKRMHWIDLEGNGSILPSVFRGDDSDAIFGEVVMYDLDKIFAVGGAESREPYRRASPRAYTIDISLPDSRDPVVERQPDMAWRRVYLNAVVLPNGNIVVVGGQTSPFEFSDNFAVMYIEMFDPWSKTWVEFNQPLSTPRNYHSAAILMKDGRIAVGGGGLSSINNLTAPYNHLDLEILTPPYLVLSNGTLAVRPVVVVAPDEFQVGGTLSVTMDTNSSQHTFVLMRLGSSTHSTNLDQRRVPLSIMEQDGAVFYLSVPAHPVHVPPGYYWLFAMNGAGVPSVGHTLLRTVAAS